MKVSNISGLTFFIMFLLLLTACFSKKDNYPFSETELDFLAYDEGQNLSFIDTSGVTHALLQHEYKRDFYEVIGILGSQGFYERYKLAYRPANENQPVLRLSLESHMSELNIDFFGYTINALVDPPFSHPSLAIIHESIAINGNSYEDVYTLTATRYPEINKADTATLFWNKEYGILQLLLPNGKSVTRVD